MDRRARKKAQTRELIRSVARRLFDEHGFEAVTIADIARESDVAVQTVFNHFATKEELFFDGRTPGWTARPRRSGSRPVGPPLSALRDAPGRRRRRTGRLPPLPDRRRYIATLEASDALRAHERELVHAVGDGTARRPAEAWAADDGRPGGPGVGGVADRSRLAGDRPVPGRSASGPG